MGKKFSKKNKDGLWTVQFSEIIATLQVLEKNGFTVEMMKQLRGKGGNEKAKKIVALFLEAVAINANYDDLKKSWQDFYVKYFHIAIDLSAVKIPTPKPGFKRLLIVVPGISPNSVVAVQRNYFKTWVYTNDLDAAIIHNDRDASNGAYAIWVRDTVEPDQKYRNRSANWAKDNNVSGETLLERLIHGFKYWDENKDKKNKHLDVNGNTLCTGSRGFDGGVPRVYFVSGDVRVCVYWCRLADASGRIGLRETVSCES